MIDMDDLLGDADFGSELSIYRRPIDMRTGVATSTPLPIVPAPWGSVQSGANPELIRLSDFSTADNFITVYTSFILVTAGATGPYPQNPTAVATTDAFGNQVLPPITTTYMADIVFWHGDPYEAFAVQDWSDAGAGFCEATCRKISSGEAGF